VNYFTNFFRKSESLFINKVHPSLLSLC